MSAILNVVKNHNFWYALIFIGIAAALAWLGVIYITTNTMLGMVLMFMTVVFSGLSTTFFVITGVQSARRSRSRSEGYV